MLTWIVLLRILVLGFIVTVGLAYWSAARRNDARDQCAWLLGVSSAFFAWLMGWLG